MSKKRKIFVILFCTIVVACGIACIIYQTKFSPRAHQPTQILFQPFDDVPKTLYTRIYNRLRLQDSGIKMGHTIAIPQSAYYAPRNRYRADSILHYLSSSANKGETIIAITQADVSITKDEHKDWGVIGLGQCPGNACVVSTFRLSKRNTEDQLYKICLHELGHTRGLPHCPEKYCYMRDAEGHNVSDELKRFCDKCEGKLASTNSKLFSR